MRFYKNATNIKAPIYVYTCEHYSLRSYDGTYVCISFAINGYISSNKYPAEIRFKKSGVEKIYCKDNNIGIKGTEKDFKSNKEWRKYLKLLAFQ